MRETRCGINDKFVIHFVREISKKTPDGRGTADRTILSFNEEVTWTGVMCSRRGTIGRLSSTGTVVESGAI
jgi:hypothetical protein